MLYLGSIPKMAACCTVLLKQLDIVALDAYAIFKHLQVQ